MDAKKVPDIIIGRLPVYLRTLRHLKEQGAHTTSSLELSRLVDVSAAQIRKDLSQFGEFGKQGTGYNIAFLIEKLLEILNIERVWDVALIGAGDVGHALAHYQGFVNSGFRISMIFDNDPVKIKQQIGLLSVQDASRMVEVIRSAGIKIAMLTVPASAAQEVTDKLVEAGITAILNYSPISLNVPQGVQIQNIDPAVGLQRMTYYLV